MRRAGRAKFLILPGIAMLLLLAQLALAAGHLHLPPASPAGLAAVELDGQRAQSVPVDEDEEPCPSCWIQAACGSVLAPHAPELSYPRTFAAALQRPAGSGGHRTERVAAFRPRAPPAKSSPLAS